MKARSKLPILKRRQQVADLALQGWTQLAIAEQLGVSQATICQDLKELAAEWRESSVRDVELLREMELQKLTRLEREAWLAWERSQKPAQSADIEGEGAGAPTRKRIRNQYGDPRFLDQINRSIVSRRALLGLDAPTRIAPTTPDGSQPYLSASLPVIESLSAEQFEKLKAANEILEQASTGESYAAS